MSAELPVKPRGPSLEGSAERNAFTELVEKYSSARDQAVADIRAGFPVTLLQQTSKFFDLPVAQIRKIAGVPSTTAHNWIRQKANMDIAASERVWRMADVTAMAVDVFDGEEGAKRWLTSPNRSLQGSSPLEFLDTEPGAIAVRQILNAIATGGAA